LASSEALNPHAAQIPTAFGGWSSEKILFRLKQRIIGDAEYVLSDTIHLTFFSDFMNLLKIRFGSDVHAERYRAELA
jgi:hypothetical protein